MTNKFIPGQMYRDRRGREYMFVGYAPNAPSYSQTVFTMGRALAQRNLQGKSSNSDYDILMTKDVWVNIYRNEAFSTGIHCGTGTYPSEELAKEAARCAGIAGYLFSQKITVEV